MMNKLKRKFALLSIGALAIGGAVALDVASAPKAEAATTTYTYMWHPWAPAGQQCQMFAHVKYTWMGNAIGYKNYSYLYRHVPNYVCGM